MGNRIINPEEVRLQTRAMIELMPHIAKTFKIRYNPSRRRAMKLVSIPPNEYDNYHKKA